MKKSFDQTQTPYVDALKTYISENVVPFDVPGHHLGNVNNPAVEVLGRQIYKADVNAPIGMDNLANPHGVLLEAEELFADATGADEAFFLINGTSSGILAMIMTAVKANEKIILPRNVHKSIINALILSGAIPAYVMPEIDPTLEIANQPSLAAWKKAILKNPSAKAIFVINPTYFGAVTDLASLVQFAHEHNMAVLVDEAHGAHYYFHASRSPKTAMDAGADMASVSIHKTAGSLTQSSVLLAHTERFSRYDIQKTLNILNTTSPSTLLVASLDGARQYMATKGKKAQEKTYNLVDYAVAEIDQIPGFRVAGKEHFLDHGCYDYDESKLVIELDRLDISGFDLYYLAKKKYNIQFELAETYAVLCIITIGTTKTHIDRLVAALKKISKAHFRPRRSYPIHRFDSRFPFAVARPRAAYHAPGKVIPLEECEGCISREMVMVYPPGIPLIVPGEVWTKELINRVKRYHSTGITMLSSYPDGFEVIDVDNWKRYSVYKKKLDDYLDHRITTPLNDGFHMPFEGEKHKATVVLLPFRNDTWRKKAAPAIKAYKEVIAAIAEHEPVIVGIAPTIYGKVIDRFESMDNVTPIRIRYNDAWARDNMSIFVTNGNTLRAVDFRFNAWGGEYDGLYGNWKADDKLSSAFDKRFKYPEYRHPTFIFEGGSIAVDGEGTAITTEACLLSPGRNPSMRKEEIEETVKEYLGLEKLIWVPHGIYEDETNEHIDNMVAFIRPGVVALAWCKDRSDPQYAYCMATLRALNAATDAKGRKLEIHKIPLPSPALHMTKEEAKGITNAKTAKDRLENSRLAASYINFYQGEDFVILPQFGVPEDDIAYKEIQKLFPEKKIHRVSTREILLGGGNIHCITQQIPEVKKDED